MGWCQDGAVEVDEAGASLYGDDRHEQSTVQSVAYSLDGRHIVSGSDDNTVRIWDSQTGQPVGQSLQGHTGYVQSVAYSPDGRHTMSGSDDQTIKIWNSQTLQQSHTDWVQSMEYFPESRSHLQMHILPHNSPAILTLKAGYILSSILQT
ncbi:WD40 repeat-like protein [Dendrothele bispora CBS 962.96]|uniref:WD40 repeat-like protein n=1 Tax=Dendrothele bispora (strain CBS 962.96) TaxID=1314807 RepID=A0A4S8KQC6_DENBC|nr:WD40 repeat-like protein [Dendrothele bispora CBS 962.96]